MIDPFRLAKPILHALDPETAHRASLKALALGLVPSPRDPDPPSLATTLFGHRLTNPLGLAAGFDKNAVAHRRLHALGFGHVEIGGVTPLPQPGNPRPRLFRLEADRAVVNRMGFNNDGAAAVAERLGDRDRGKLLGVNLASNTESADPVADFIGLVERFADMADYLTLDISCPNTRNGRLFLEPGPLATLLDGITARFAVLGRSRPRLLAKLAPDLSDRQLQDVVTLVERAGLEGLVLSNTTAERPADLRSPRASERGGLSGPPLFKRSTALLAEVHAATAGRLTLIGVGGIDGGMAAYTKIRAGASALQLYTALVYEGPAILSRIKREMADLLASDGFQSIGQAVGAGQSRTIRW